VCGRISPYELKNEAKIDHPEFIEAFSSDWKALSYKINIT